MIKRWFVYCSLIVLTVSFLAPDMQGMQLFRVGNLVQHVEDHFGEDWTWSELQSFVWDHYTNETLPADKKHDQLPFKSHAANGCMLAQVTENQIGIVLSDPVETSGEDSFIDMDEPVMYRSGNIWTPPQLS